MTKKQRAELKKEVNEIRERQQMTGAPMHPDWKVFVQGDALRLLEIIDELLSNAASNGD